MILRVYTDGACSGNPGAGGWGVVYVSEDLQGTLSGFDPNTTNNRMELQAVVEALNNVSLKGRFKRIDVYTDSAYVVNSIKNGYLSRWRQNGWKTRKDEIVKHKDLWLEMINHLTHKKIKVNVIKVKGHSGNEYNEIADKLAKEEIAKAKRNLNDCDSVAS